MVEGIHTHKHTDQFFGQYTGKYEPEKTMYLDILHAVFNNCSL